MVETLEKTFSDVRAINGTRPSRSIIGGRSELLPMPSISATLIGDEHSAELADAILLASGFLPLPATSRYTAEDLNNAIRGVEYFRDTGVLNDHEADLLVAYMVKNFTSSQVLSAIEHPPLKFFASGGWTAP